MPSEYVVLQHFAVDPDETSDDWRVIGRATAATPKAAITFVACPVRSWQPVTRRVEAAEKEIWE